MSDSPSSSLQQQQQSKGLKLPRIDSKSAPGSAHLDSESVSLIQSCDTFFIATYSTSTSTSPSSCSQSCDISHRGGQPGFIRVLSPRTLVWPEYPGNNMFITLGNIVSNPRVGLLLIDFNRGRLLQLSGEAKLITRSNDGSSSGASMAEMDGSSRGVLLTVTQAVMTSDLGRQFSLLERSPYNPPRSGFSGSYDSSSVSTSSAALPAPSSTMHLTSVTPLSDSVASFRFTLDPPYRSSGGGFYPGQFGSVNVRLPDSLTSVTRSWTVTDLEDRVDPRGGGSLLSSIEFTIKRSSKSSTSSNTSAAAAPVVSRWLHDTLLSCDPAAAPSLWSRLMSSRGPALLVHWSGRILLHLQHQQQQQLQ